MEQPGRLRLRGWLEEQIESGKYPGVSWLDKTARIFQIPWKHAARHGWSIDRDATLFRNWAMHTGRYRPGKHKPDPKTWKANFRCALNSLPDIRELQEHSKKRGNNAYRVYKMLPSTHTLRRRKGFRLMSPAQEQQAFPSADSCNLHAWQPTTSTCVSSLDMEIPADVAFHSTQTHGHWEAKLENEEQNEAVFKLMDELGNTDLWSQTGLQRGWRTHSLWDHTHCPVDENTFSLQTEGYSELFAPNYIKESDWSMYQPTLMP